MSRPRIILTNVDRKGEISSEWHLCIGGKREAGRWIGGKWKVFSEAEWAKGGLSWLADQLKRGEK